MLISIHHIKTNLGKQTMQEQNETDTYLTIDPHLCEPGLAKPLDVVLPSGFFFLSAYSGLVFPGLDDEVLCSFLLTLQKPGEKLQSLSPLTVISFKPW